MCCAPLPSSGFKIVALTADRGGTITAVIDTAAAGAADATASTRVRAAQRKRKARRSARKPRVKTVAYGTGSATTAGAGRVRIRIGARHAALTALRRLRKLRVSVTITFSAGGRRRRPRRPSRSRRPSAASTGALGRGGIVACMAAELWTCHLGSVAYREASALQGRCGRPQADEIPDTGAPARAPARLHAGPPHRRRRPAHG